jgi:hypothetical protein
MVLLCEALQRARESMDSWLYKQDQSRKAINPFVSKSVAKLKNHAHVTRGNDEVTGSCDGWVLWGNQQRH